MMPKVSGDNAASDDFSLDLGKADLDLVEPTRKWT
jgi:hypothetical protein